jgi:acyl-coenzyme A thioesterase 13
MTNLVLISATSSPSSSPLATADFNLLVSVEYSNLNQVMHGGAAALIFDMCTTSALGPLARPGYWDFMGGVTRTLNVSYLRAVPVGRSDSFPFLLPNKSSLAVLVQR